jgi:hypothetical protein
MSSLTTATHQLDRRQRAAALSEEGLVHHELRGRPTQDIGTYYPDIVLGCFGLGLTAAQGSPGAGTPLGFFRLQRHVRGYFAVDS